MGFRGILGVLWCWACFCFVGWIWNYDEIRSGGRVMVDLGVRTFFVLIWGFSGDSGGAVGLGVFFCVEWIWNYVEIRSGCRFIMFFGGSKTFSVYNWRFSKKLLNFASMTPHRSAPGSPSKASELDFMIIKLWTKTWFQNIKNRLPDHISANSTTIRHEKTCPTSQHPPNLPKTTKLDLKILNNI